MTDADVLLGRLKPDYSAAGLRPEVAAAERAIRERDADSLGVSVVEAVRGTGYIADSHIADLVRKVTIENGHDPRDFVLIAYGGAGPRTWSRTRPTSACGR